jgi:hypothetical protein
MATTAPFMVSGKMRWTYSCSRMSTVRRTGFPGVGASAPTVERGSTTRPLASTSTKRAPSSPARISSYFFSIPACPISRPCRYPRLLYGSASSCSLVISVT